METEEDTVDEREKRELREVKGNRKSKLTLHKALENADIILLKKYLNKLDKLQVVKADRKITDIEIGANICLYHLDKIVYDREENIHDKLTTVYMSMFSNKEAALTLIVRGFKDKADLYIGAVSRDLTKEGRVLAKTLDNTGNVLENMLKGNFPGTELHRVDIDKKKDEENEYVKAVINGCFSEISTIAAVSGVAALRNPNENAGNGFVQGMEKLIDSMRGREYTAVYLADVMDRSIVEELCSDYENIYSELSIFGQWIYNVNQNRSKTDTTGVVEGAVDTINTSTANAVTHGKTSSVTSTKGKGAGGSIQLGKKSWPVQLGVSGNFNVSEAEQKGINNAETDTITQGEARAKSKQKSKAKAVTFGTGMSMQFTKDNKAVEILLERIDGQLKRLRSCEDFGLFDSCVYFLSNRYENAVAAASAYSSLIRGENSSAEASAINIWTRERGGNSKKEKNSKAGESADKVELLSEYLKRFYHPMFALEVNNKIGTGDALGRLYVTPALMVSGRELAFSFSLPKKSVSGLPVLECAEFGRNVMSMDGIADGGLEIGSVYHMRRKEETKVLLAAQDLTSHTFITGSTGAGKSNAVYQVLSELVKIRYPEGCDEEPVKIRCPEGCDEEPVKIYCPEDCDEEIIKKRNVTFLVVEPKKGEYKDIFGCDGEIKADVYGTNPLTTPLLRINPFRFPASTHIYEHMDRLTELFNVCWPMYAAMPAVLKAALENAYVAAGWNLEKSENETGVNIYPSFASLAREVKKYIDVSEYSAENKGNYKGALLTRLESLANGINGMIFTADDLSDEDLFDKNVIVDLSKVGSTETKSLIMGLLVMKLQEYRMGTSVKNSRLKHATVLEEAHCLLKRTSAEQSAESANLLGKSVEMISDSIAEMRTYGEAFIIADQAPGLLDMSVIRNTNTKIIFRLPDYSDRELAGRAANLNDKQIEELARLKRGVAAVYQNNWIEPVLCEFEKFEAGENVYINPEKRKSISMDGQQAMDILMRADTWKRMGNPEERKKLIRRIAVSKIPDDLKVRILKYLMSEKKELSEEEFAKIVREYYQYQG
ncbi:MAG: DUF87 domain-containing protein [Clostridium sp.]|nr:DUF87 domain-containing protein [Clostridium sp.]